MQQLDLFANFSEAPPVKPAEKKPAPVAAENLPVEETEEETTPVKKEKPGEQEQPLTKQPVYNKVSASGKRGRKSFKDMDADIIMVEIPEDDVLYQKQYYSIGEVAKWFHVNQSLLRFWETEFPILKPRKTRKGDRLFRPEDIKNLQLIYYLLRQRKFSIEGARQYLKDNKKKGDAQMQIIQSLTKFRAFLLEWRSNLGA